MHWMSGQGIQSEYIWNIFQPWFLNPFMTLGRRLFLRKEDMFGDYDRYYRTRKDIFRYPGLKSFFHFFYFGEYLFRFATKIRLSLMKGTSIVCDRYVYDIVAGHAANLDYPAKRVNTTINRLLRLMPKPDIVFFIDAPEELAFERKDDVPSLGYLQKRRKIYLESVKQYCSFVLDGSEDPIKLEEAVQLRIRQHLANRN